MSMPWIMALIYVAMMFAGTALAHRYRQALHNSSWRIYAYTLAFAVYCTSWTYFGAVGSAATGGWDFLPIYLGPILLMALGGRFLRRLNVEVHKEGATSISDFIAARFGKSRSVAALVTMIALFGTIPYIALQLRSVALSFALVSGTPESTGPLLVAAVVLAIFAIVFGARRYQVSGQNEAILFAIAFESVLKLGAILLVSGLAVWLLWTIPDRQALTSLEHFRGRFALDTLDADFLVTMLVSVMAIVCLPRHFFISVTQARHPDDILRARWGFIAYLVITVLAVLPIAGAGVATLDRGAMPDLFVISLPQQFGFDRLTLFVFLGGISAAVAMVVTETVAISSMISNDLFAPILLRRSTREVHLGEQLLWIRRSTIIGLMAAAAGYAMLTPSATQLASVGLIAFVAMAQCTPALIFAVYRTDNDALAAKGSLMVGFLLWFVLLFLPTISGNHIGEDARDMIPFAAFEHLSPVTSGALISLSGNLLAYMLLAARKVGKEGIGKVHIRHRGVSSISTVAGLVDLVTRFVGMELATEAFGPDSDRARPIDRASVRTAERLIGSVVGVPSARAIMASAISGQGMGLADVTQMLDASGQSLHFSQGLLAATLENIDIGVSAVDRDLRLIAWNGRYLELFTYPPGLVRIGVPIAELIRYNAERGDCGPGEVDSHVARRLDHMRSRQQHSFERYRADGRVIKTVGGPMPDGGYVMSFTDITMEAQARAATETARKNLESAVAERTAELSEVNDKLARAMRDKTRFLAAASHDLLQPLHAAMLFSAALRRRLEPPEQAILARLDRSIEAANDLLRALLDISKLDAGGVQIAPDRFAVRPLLVDLAESFQPLAAEKGLRLRIGPSDGWVECDRTLLRSIMQNFLSNAIRYTEQGGVIIAARRRGARIQLAVYDSGIGIPPDKLTDIFREFERLGQAAETGIGLGLAIVERSAPLVGGTITVRSWPGKGSVFSISLPRVAQAAVPPKPTVDLANSSGVSRHLLVVDDDPTNRDAMRLVLDGLGHRCITAADEQEALDCAGVFDGALIDFHLGNGRNGIDLIDALRVKRPCLPFALVTAEGGQAMLEQARTRGVAVLPKPLTLAMLDQWIAAQTLVD
ncbi:multi-sensor hybrid histidine kinase [Novosphingobium sp. Rr 2-17]|uniref:hybrid sensor histidine kinase/response regulator n=1 Tax=Novosphingobium sp. Rr 2-17 TaxID=555793 RepID=UPI00026984A2|nr:PAS-domain containing protein [Novosphingobium sp. Rr 2-17]EIZ81265.1 multi-sensor hybrid histidine kinase [Novosphingobium sp. Rr 2-17]